MVPARGLGVASKHDRLSHPSGAARLTAVVIVVARVEAGAIPVAIDVNFAAELRGERNGDHAGRGYPLPTHAEKVRLAPLAQKKRVDEVRGSPLVAERLSYALRAAAPCASCWLVASNPKQRLLRNSAHVFVGAVPQWWSKPEAPVVV